VRQSCRSTRNADGSIGPAFAIPKALEKAGITKDDVDFYEINEAFASQAVMSIQHLHLPFEKVNPNGGAIAIGHPLGATGARQIATAMAEAKREKKKVFVTSMCIGSGMVSHFTRRQAAGVALTVRVWLPCLSVSSEERVNDWGSVA
jgi:acetyl-CoA acyltransferase 1